jgi:hypothetical protein
MNIELPYGSIRQSLLKIRAEADYGLTELKTLEAEGRATEFHAEAMGVLSSVRDTVIFDVENEWQTLMQKLGVGPVVDADAVGPVSVNAAFIVSWLRSDLLALDRLITRLRTTPPIGDSKASPDLGVLVLLLEAVGGSTVAALGNVRRELGPVLDSRDPNVMSDLSTLERAVSFAARAHAGQVDKAGRAYIFHPLRMMERVKTTEQKMAAVLHDVVEDCGVTLEQLRAEGFPQGVVDAVDNLTKRVVDGAEESYEEFIRRAAEHPIARHVKLADLEDNMDLSRIATPTAKDFARVEKYRAAKVVIERAIAQERGGQG